MTNNQILSHRLIRLWRKITKLEFDSLIIEY